MKKAIGVGIGIGVVLIAIVIVGGSTMLGDQSSLPFDDDNKMQMGDKVSVTVEQGVTESSNSEGKNLEINLVDGISATSEP